MTEVGKHRVVVLWRRRENVGARGVGGKRRHGASLFGVTKTERIRGLFCRFRSEAEACVRALNSPANSERVGVPAKRETRRLLVHAANWLTRRRTERGGLGLGGTIPAKREGRRFRFLRRAEGEGGFVLLFGFVAGRGAEGERGFVVRRLGAETECGLGFFGWLGAEGEGS